MLKTIDRLIQFIDYTGLSARQFDISIGAANGYTLRMKKNHASIGSDVIENILRTYPQLNVVWLITGKEEMIQKNQKVGGDDFNKIPDDHKKFIEEIVNVKIAEIFGNQKNKIRDEVVNEFLKYSSKKSST